jgi:hypothetical protein
VCHELLGLQHLTGRAVHRVCEAVAIEVHEKLALNGIDRQTHV